MQCSKLKQLLKLKLEFNMNKRILITAAILGVIGIVLGAFAAHGLSDLLSQNVLRSFETGVRYQMYHAIFLLVLGGYSFLEPKAKNLIFLLVLSGLFLFSGSIYGLSTNSLTSFDFKSIAFLTPIGGILLILSWVVLLINFLKIKADI